ncbi:HNH endonuclease signature motif containing protein [Microcoleus sp. FACHB-68]|uniref:HNH endonuclease n=1 Tax=Microcoleus sp. FACHB-68 TaxID=2692826 RepID=UPI001682384E|nr:HNH endonuclease signature motif containing protein [Microcoleus sp. FACHB-68]MBD1936328.1 HNH endonuclease [Microcoleus sp. FACHB-68]
MEFEEIHSFFNTTADKLEACWDIQILSNIANQRVPDFIMSGRGSLLRADIHILWTQWFIESICDPEKFTDSTQSYGHILVAVQKTVPIIFSGISEEERKTLTRYISRLIDKEVQRRSPRKRSFISLEDKKLLWDIYGPEPRCWICGYKFTKWAENKFLGYENYTETPLFQFIDYMTLHGLSQRDICVEVDHAIPFSKGGKEEDNLRLACGWCNSHKSDRISVYDVAIKPRTVEHPKLGKQSVPHPFWVVRLLSVRRRCEYENGCDNTVDHAQLTVVHKHPEGAMNPTNLRVICSEHDPLGSTRLVSREVAEQMRK